MRGWRVVVLTCFLGAAALSALSAGPASATSCAIAGAQPANPYALHPVLFVGMVTSTSHGDRVARVRVEDVWRGPALPPEVEVVGSPVALTPVPAGMGLASTDDRHYAVGERYLFAPHGDVPAALALGAAQGQPPRLLNYGGCDVLTRPYDPALEALRPARGGEPPTALASPLLRALPLSGGASASNATGTWLAAVLLLSGAGLALARRRTRPTGPAAGYPRRSWTRVF